MIFIKVIFWEPWCYLNLRLTPKIKHAWWGFQSESNIITVSAVWRLRPKPPARVDSKKTKYGDCGALNFSKSNPRSSALVVPSSRRYRKSINIETHYKIETLFVIVQCLCRRFFLHAALSWVHKFRPNNLLLNFHTLAHPPTTEKFRWRQTSFICDSPKTDNSPWLSIMKIFPRAKCPSGEMTQGRDFLRAKRRGRNVPVAKQGGE